MPLMSCAVNAGEARAGPAADANAPFGPMIDVRRYPVALASHSTSALTTYVPETGATKLSVFVPESCRLAVSKNSVLACSVVRVAVGTDSVEEFMTEAAAAVASLSDVTAPLAMSAALTWPSEIFPLPTASVPRSAFLTSPFLMSCDLIDSSMIWPLPMVAAAYAVPPRATNSATRATIIAADGRGTRILDTILPCRRRSSPLHRWHA